jgi:hypothetical protein
MTNTATFLLGNRNTIRLLAPLPSPKLTLFELVYAGPIRVDRNAQRGWRSILAHGFCPRRPLH